MLNTIRLAFWENAFEEPGFAFLTFFLGRGTATGFDARKSSANSRSSLRRPAAGSFKTLASGFSSSGSTPELRRCRRARNLERAILFQLLTKRPSVLCKSLFKRKATQLLAINTCLSSLPGGFGAVPIEEWLPRLCDRVTSPLHQSRAWPLAHEDLLLSLSGWR